jgi:tetratricopeptide (TPR) repeat protein
MIFDQSGIVRPRSVSHGKGTLSLLIGRSWKKLKDFQYDSKVSAEEMKLTHGLFELLMFKEDWGRVAKLAARTILKGTNTSASLICYRYWIESLKEQGDVAGLQALARHLLEKRTHSNSYMALAGIALCFAGRRSYARAVFREFTTKKYPRTRAVIEFFSIWLLESCREKDRVNGIKILAKLANRSKNSYIISREFLVYSLECEEIEFAQVAKSTLLQCFPFAPDAVLLEGRICEATENTSGAARHYMTVVEDNPKHCDAILALAECFRKLGDLVAAKSLLQSSIDFFEPEDFDYNVAVALVHTDLHERFGRDEHRKVAIRRFSQGLKSGIKYKVSTSFIEIALRKLNAGVGESLVLAPAQNGDSIAAWILRLSAHQVTSLLQNDNFLLRLPLGVEMGQKILIVSSNKNSASIDDVVAICEVTSPLVEDIQFGFTALVKVEKLIDSKQTIELHDVETIALDKFGCSNFASRGLAQVSSVSKEMVQEILAPTILKELLGSAMLEAM